MNIPVSLAWRRIIARRMRCWAHPGRETLLTSAGKLTTRGGATVFPIVKTGQYRRGSSAGCRTSDNACYSADDSLRREFVW